MPTYYACGVTATLATCDLQSSLSNVTSLKQGAEQQRDAARIQSLFSAADKLCERPIGEDGSEKGIMRFIGVDEDMPLYMVEAEPKIVHKQDANYDVEMQEAHEESHADSANELPALSDDSSLTSLGATPSPITQTFNDSPLKEATPVQLTEDAIASLTNKSDSDDRIQAVQSHLMTSTAQALILDVQVSDKSFLPQDSRPTRGIQSTSKDLKIEVFLNGQLADVGYIHGTERRRTAVQISGDKVRFSGTRIYRQVEKPWIYSRGSTGGGGLPDSQNDGEHRWNVIGMAYVREATTRGCDKLGELPPSAKFLMALGNLELPQRMRDHLDLGVVDLVITAGKGRKYGPETFYLTRPTRMDDPNYLLQVPLYPNGNVDFETPIQDTYLPKMQNVFQDVSFTPNHTPAMLSTVSPLAGKIIDLIEELNLDIDPSKLLVGNYENSRGFKGKSGRTLLQRLGDLKKMNSANMERESAKLKDEFGVKEPASKKLKLDRVGAQFDVFMPNPTLSTETTIDPTKLLIRPPPDVPYGIDPEAVLTQNRIDMALNEGAASNGALLRRIASTSPQRTPKKATKAAALAGSPTSTPVKSQRRTPRTPHRTKSGADSSPVSKQAKAASEKAELSPSRPRNDTKMTTSKAKSAEEQVSEALKAFKIPDCCRGSCVSYQENVNVSRQIGKVRGGEFKEETLVVGMRFVVL